MDAYKNTEILLRKYRDVVWNIQVAKIQLDIKTESPINEFLELGFTYDIRIEEQAKILDKNKRMIELINKALELIQNKQKNGQEYYKILYYTYISEEKFDTCQDVIDRLNYDGYYMAEKTYFKKRNQAVKVLAEILFGV